jgi:hypothetical protein
VVVVVEVVVVVDVVVAILSVLYMLFAKIPPQISAESPPHVIEQEEEIP